MTNTKAPHAMKMGIALANFGAYADVRLLAELTADAEAAGWDGVFLADTMQMVGYEDAPVVNPWMALTAEVPAPAHG